MKSYTIIWLIVLIICIGVELGTMGLTSIWFAGGSVPAIIAAAFGGPVWLQVIDEIAILPILRNDLFRSWKRCFRRVSGIAPLPRWQEDHKP